MTKSFFRVLCKTVDYIADVLNHYWKCSCYLFLYIFSGVVALIRIAAVLSGGTIGGVTSPVLTAMSAGITEADHMKNVKVMSPYNLSVGVLAVLAFLAITIIGAGAQQL